MPDVLSLFGPGDQFSLFDVGGAAPVELVAVSPTVCVGCGKDCAATGGRSYSTAAGLGALCTRCQDLGVTPGVLELDPTD